MSNLPTAAASFTAAQLQIIRKTCAPDTNEDEFNLFVESARLYGLNPMKRQIMAMVFSKDDAKKRRMSLIVEIGGLRAIAARSGQYRPASVPTVFETDSAAKSETNPHGLIRAIVTIHKQDSKGDWHDVAGEAWWEEHANIKDEWAWSDADKKRKPTGKKTLEDNWKRMPRLMLAKCAEAQALRKGWPEDLGGLFEQAESAGAWDADMLPTDVLEKDEADSRARRIGRVFGEYALQFDMGAPIEMIAPGAFHDRVIEYARTLETVMEIKQFRATNALTLQRFWADDKDAALDLKKALDDREAFIIKQAEQEPA